MKKYNVTGMSCAACSARVEKAVSQVEGVSSCTVNLLTNSMTVDGNASASSVIEAVKKAGYGASEEGAKKEDKSSSKNGNGGLILRLIFSLVLLVPLMYISMGHLMWNAPLPEVLRRDPMAIGLVELLLTAAVMVINQKFFINGAKGLFKGTPNMDTLVALGSGAAFCYSVYELFVLSAAMYNGDVEGARHALHGLYFESAATILALITVGKALEARAKGRTAAALEALMDLAPKTAAVVRDGREIQIPVEEIRRGDMFVVRPGDSIPVDGVVTEGVSTADESAITGESIPIDKVSGDSVTSGTVNLSGVLYCEAVRVGEDTTLSQIIKMVSDASATKAPIARMADKVSGIFVPVVMGIAIISAAVWLLFGEDVGFALARGISVLVISCPCALGLATPVAIMVGTGKGARNGILFKNGTALETVGRIKTVVLDKTGTVTEGHPSVTDVIPAKGVDEKELLSLAASLERDSEHPLGEAVRKKAEDDGIVTRAVTELKVLSGSGLTCKLDGEELFGGSLRFVSGRIYVDGELRSEAERLSKLGITPLAFALGDRCLGLIGVADTVKEDSARAIAELKKMGIETVMLTGDNRKVAENIGKQVGIDRVIAEVMPDEKEKTVRELKKQGRVAMVGDGINDAPALTAADVGIAIGAGSDVAIESADAVLVKSKLSEVPAAIRLGRGVIKNIKENLFWAFFYNALGIPLAAGVFIPVLGWTLEPMFGAAAMSLSSFCVVLNALRLNFIKMYPKKTAAKSENTEQKIIIENEKENEKMKKTMMIEGMMCMHCEARVKKILEELEGVNSAEVSHTLGTAVLTLDAPVSDEVLKNTVEDQGYKVTDIK